MFWVVKFLVTLATHSFRSTALYYSKLNLVLKPISAQQENGHCEVSLIAIILACRCFCLISTHQTHTHTHTHDIYICIYTHTHTWYTGRPRRNGQNFGRVFLMLNYTDITQNTYIQSWTVTEIMAREVWNFDSCYTWNNSAPTWRILIKFHVWIVFEKSIKETQGYDREESVVNQHN